MYKKYITIIVFNLFNTCFAHEHININKNYENDATYQVCSEPLDQELAYDCLALSKLSIFTDSNNNINASILDINYKLDNSKKLVRTMLTSRVMINCDAYTISVQIAPYNTWTRWDHIKEDELIYNIMDKICPLAPIRQYFPTFIK